MADTIYVIYRMQKPHRNDGITYMGTKKGNNLVKVKKQNESLIRETIYKYGPISRIEIAQMLALTPPTITTNITAMMEQGLLYECAAEEEELHSLGRRPVKLDFIADSRYVVGVEINPYQTAVCLMDLRGKQKASLWYQQKEADYSISLQYLADKIEEMVKDSKIPRSSLLGVGFGIPGFVRRSAGTVRKSTLRNWNDHNIADDLSKLLNMLVLLENNARVRAVGEEMFSRELRPDTFAYYLISYGIACPLYIKNSMIKGDQYGAGEAGHMVAVLNGPECKTCGNRGCLEEVASERAIVKQVREAVNGGRKSLVTGLCSHMEELTVREILLAQEQGDALVREILDHAIMYLGATLANIINLINLPLVIVDGYIMKLEENRERLKEETRKHIFGLYDEEAVIEFVEFDRFTGARGAAALAVKNYFIEGR